MNERLPHVSEVTAADFDREVIARSREVPVLADFWAAWCAPCGMLTPVLTRLAERYGGRFHLAKINVDTERELAARCGVRSLPTVKLFRDGRIVDEFVGALPEAAIRRILDRHVPRPSDALIGQARALAAAGKREEALRLIDEAVEIDPDSDRAHLAHARLLIDAARFADAERALKALSADARDEPEAAALQSKLHFARVAAGIDSEDALRARLEADPGDCESRYRLSAAQVLRGEFDAAVQNLLEIVKRDRAFRDDGARRALLLVFKMLGEADARVKKYRAALASVLN